MRYILFLLIVLSYVSIACSINVKQSDPLPTEGQTLLPNLMKDKFVFGSMDTAQKIKQNDIVDWNSIQKLVDQARIQENENYISILSIRDIEGSWYLYSLQGLSFTESAIEDSQGETQYYVYELNIDSLNSVPRIAVALIPNSELAIGEMNAWLQPKVDNPDNDTTRMNKSVSCGWVEVAPAASVCWYDGCNYYEAIYDYTCEQDAANDYWSWEEPTTGLGGGGSSGGNDTGDSLCKPPLCAIQDYLENPPIGVPEERYNQLTLEEKKLCWANPSRCIQIGGMVEEAFNWSRSITSVGAQDGKQDALRHAMWNALMAYEYGIVYAKKWGDAHESESTNAAAVKMDLVNNSVGREIGWRVKDQGRPKSDIGSDIIWAADNSGLCLTITNC